MGRKRNPSEAEIRAIAARRVPKGWRVVERAKQAPPKIAPAKSRSLAFSTTVGECDFETRTVFAPRLDSRYALYVLLHECGHAVLHDYETCVALPDWEIEYEAEQYAIAAMRAEGIAVPRAVLDEGRDYVASLLERDGGADAPMSVWRWAFPDTVDKRKRRG